MAQDPSPHSDLTDEDWLRCDELIFAGTIILGIKFIHEATGLSIGDALELYASRYEELRRDAPDRFKETHEEYWKGFYS